MLSWNWESRVDLKIQGYPRITKKGQQRFYTCFLFCFSYVHDNFWELLTALLIISDIFAVLFYLKGIFLPTNSDATYRGNFLADFYLGICFIFFSVSVKLFFFLFSGIELHPKIGALNCKLFNIGNFCVSFECIRDDQCLIRMYKG